MAAFGAAVAAGFPAIELDLRLTKDGMVVVLHDDSLKRTAGTAGRVSDLSWSELQDLAEGSAPIPKLDDLLRTLRAWDGLWNFELKVAGAAGPVAELARHYKLGGRALLSSMNPAALEAARDDAPDMKRALIPVGPVDDEDLEAAKDLGCAWFNVDHDYLDAEDVKRFRDAGLKVGAWTVNDAGAARKLVAMGVDCVITDVRDVHAALRPAGANPSSW